MNLDLDYALIGRNIRFLRNKNHETLVKVSRDLDVDKGTLSRYETGNSPVTSDVIEKIAKRYGHTVDEICKQDLTDDSCIRMIIDNFDIVSEMMERAFQFIDFDETGKDSLFAQALSAFEKVDLERIRDFEIAIDEALPLFLKSYETNGTIEAAANYIIFFFMKIAISTNLIGSEILNDGTDLKQNYEDKIESFMQFYKFLPMHIREYFKKQETRYIIPMLKALKMNGYYDLAEFYDILRIVLGCCKYEQVDYQILGYAVMVLLREAYFSGNTIINEAIEEIIKRKYS